MKSRFLVIILVSLIPFITFVSAQTTFYENPNDFYIFSTPSSTDSSSVVSDVGSIYSSGGCITDWDCTDWGECINNTQIRTCYKIDENCYAGTAPEETQPCTPNAIISQKINGTAGQNGTGPSSKANFLLIFLISGGVIISLAIAFIIIKAKLKKSHP